MTGEAVRRSSHCATSRRGLDSGCNKLKIGKNGDKALKFLHSIGMMMLYQFKMGAHAEIFLRFLNFMFYVFVFLIYTKYHNRL